MCKGDVGRLAVGAPASHRFPQAPVLVAWRWVAGPVHQVVEPAVPLARPQPPVVLSRNGKEFTLTGETNIRAGTEIKVSTERPSVALRLSELDSGSWVIFEPAGIHHCSLRYAAGQPGCAAQCQRHLVLQGQGLTLGQGCLQR